MHILTCITVTILIYTALELLQYIERNEFDDHNTKHIERYVCGSSKMNASYLRKCLCLASAISLGTTIQKKAANASGNKLMYLLSTFYNYLYANVLCNVCMYVREVLKWITILSKKLFIANKFTGIQFIRSPEENVPTRGFQTQSGLKYFDIKTSDVGRTPLYGAYIQTFIHI